MNLSEFDKLKIRDLIAAEPANPRNSSRLISLDRQKKDIKHLRFKDILNLIDSNDCLVLNKSKVQKAKLTGTKSSGGKVEILLVNPLDENLKTWSVLAKKISEGNHINLKGCNKAVCVKREISGGYIAEFKLPLNDEYLEAYGEVPLPNYIIRARKEAQINSEYLKDDMNYQTVYAKDFGSIAAPTAGFHFTGDMLEKLKSKGVKILFVTLHIGWGTFKPVRTENPAEHIMLPEECSIDEKTAEDINNAKKNGNRIIAVGTSSMRTLETFANDNNFVSSGRKNAELFIYPGYKFKIANAFITNLHVPGSAPLYMTSAFAGKQFLFSAYEEAVKKKYRFYSYGDSMFIV